MIHIYPKITDPKITFEQEMNLTIDMLNIISPIIKMIYEDTETVITHDIILQLERIKNDKTDDWAVLINIKRDEYKHLDDEEFIYFRDNYKLQAPEWIYNLVNYIKYEEEDKYDENLDFDLYVRFDKKLLYDWVKSNYNTYYSYMKNKEKYYTQKLIDTL
jgi:hypothetical protein